MLKFCEKWVMLQKLKHFKKDNLKINTLYNMYEINSK